MLTSNQLHVLLELVQRQMAVFAASTLGPEILSDQDKQILKENGLDYTKLYDSTKDLVDLNFHLGLLSKVLGDEKVKSFTYDQLQQYIKSGQHIPLNARERAIVHSVKMQSMADIRSVNQRIFRDVNNVVANELGNARADQEEYLRDQIATGVGERKNRRSIARQIARLTGDWSRDFNKSVQYISHTALNEGRMAMIHRKHGDNSAKIYFQVQTTACTQCVKAYLKNGPGSEPIVFTLGELERNGSNIGRKQKEWKPVIKAMHPYCRCLATEFQEGSVWIGSKFMLPTKPVINSNRPKIRVTVNGEDYWV